ncbi:MAG: DUF4325 domain-containing protein [Mycoplasmataceae bacterium]|nr:DUF4325 domain-containing protein [Mycoplasmataceae bacterium]
MNKTYIEMKKYGNRISEQEIGNEVFNEYHKEETKMVLDFENVSNATTAFFNSLFSEILKVIDLADLAKFIGLKNPNEQIKNNFLISLELAKYYEQ